MIAGSEEIVQILQKSFLSNSTREQYNIQLKSKVAYTLQNLKMFNYFTKIRAIIQNACCCLFSTDLNIFPKIRHLHIRYILFVFVF